MLKAWIVFALMLAAVRNSGAAPPAEPRFLSGRVIATENAAASGAAVGLVLFDGEDFREFGATTTDAVGRFRFEQVPAIANAPAAGGHAQLYVRTPGSGVAVKAFLPTNDELEIRLSAPVDLKFRVTKATGEPMSGIPMRADTLIQRGTYNFVSLPPLATARFSAVTDADGHAVIHALPAGWDVRLVFDDQRYAPPSPQAIVRWIALGTGPEKIVTEPYVAVPAATVAGRVLYEGGDRPASGVRVSAQSSSGGMGHADTDPHGRFEIKGLPPGAFDLRVVLRTDMPDWTSAARPGEPVAAGARLDGQDLVLIKGALITGRVASSETGRGVPGLFMGATVRPSGSWGRYTTTDADGRYSLRVPPGKKHVYLGTSQMPDGFAEPEKKSEDVTVANGETITVNFALSAAAATDYVTGQVVSRAGQPVAKAHVLMAPAEGHMHGNPETQSGDDGRFRLKLPKLEAGADSVRLLASHPQSGATAQPVVVQRGKHATLTLDPAGLATVEGRVLDPAGQPIAGATVTASTSLGDFRGAHPRQETDAAGRYGIAELWPGTEHRVRVEARGFGRTGADEFILTPGETKLVPDLALARADLTLAGRVIDGQSQPVAGARVVASSASTDDTTTTAADGTFRLKNLTPGWFSLTLVHRDNSYYDLLRAKAGSTDVLVEKPDDPGETFDSPRPQKNLATHLLGKVAPVPAIEPGSWIGEALPGDLATALQGKVVLLDFWAVLCGGCVNELPHIETFWRENKARGLLVLGIGSRRHPTAEVREFLTERKLSITYPLARDARGRSTAATYGVPFYPCYAVIDRAGRLAYLGHVWADAKAKAAALLTTDSR